jgi:hypothetical protein
MFNPEAKVSKRLSRVHNFVLPTNLIDTNKCTSTKPMPKPNKARVSINKLISSLKATGAFGKLSNKAKIVCRCGKLPNANSPRTKDELRLGYFVK